MSALTDYLISTASIPVGGTIEAPANFTDANFAKADGTALLKSSYPALGTALPYSPPSRDRNVTSDFF